MYERFTDRARKVMELTNGAALQLNCEWIGPEHLLSVLLRTPDCAAVKALRLLKLDLKQLEVSLTAKLTIGPEIVTATKLPQTPRLTKVIELAMHHARELNHNYVGTEHMLLGIVSEPLHTHKGDSSIAAMVLREHGVTFESAQDAVLRVLGNIPGPAPSTHPFEKHDPWKCMSHQLQLGRAVHGVYNLGAGFLHVVLGEAELPDTHPIFKDGQGCDVREEANPDYLLIRIHGSEINCYVPKHKVGFISAMLGEKSS